MSLRDILDKAGDMFMPKELAPFAGPLAMAFAGPLGPYASLALGQLGSAKMHSGKLDPYTALGTFMANRGSGYTGTTLDDRLGAGLGTLFDGTKGNTDLFAGFRKDFIKPNVGQDIANVNLSKNVPPTERVGYSGTTDRYTGHPVYGGDVVARYEDKDFFSDFPGVLEEQPTPIGTEATELAGTVGTEIKPKESFWDKTVGAFDSVSETIFPGFNDPETNKFSPMRALTTIGAVTTVSQLMPMAEELKKQKELDRAEEAKIWKEWFDGYKRVSGRDYIDSPYPDPTLMEKYKQYMASGGRVGYNLGGIADTIEVAPGMPEGMQIDGRDGIFISQGVREKADDVPAMLSKNEFVLTADAMKGFDKMTGGSGDPRAAAKKMYEMMDQMEAIA